MGGVCSSDEDTMDKKINKRLEKEHKSDPKKLLLLGAGMAGKSTIFKQVKIIYEDGFSTGLREQYKVTVHANVIEGIKTLVDQAQRTATSFSPEGLTYASELLALGLDESLTPEIGHKIRHMWENEESIKLAFSRRSGFQLGDSVPYMLNNVKRICSPDYVPTEEDVVRVRVRTSGIEEMRFQIAAVQFLIVDVGGQRGERKKWIHCFSNVQAVLFVAAISEYDQVIQEDSVTNSLLESLNLFGDICNLDIFERTAMILFLNKSDLFTEKMNNKVGDLKRIFPEYEGKDNTTDTLSHVS